MMDEAKSATHDPLSDSDFEYVSAGRYPTL